MISYPASFGDSIVLSLFTVELDSIRETGRLGSGDDEFNLPTDIAGGFSAGGLKRIFITDRVQQRVDVYNDSLRFLYATGSTDLEDPLSAVEPPSGGLFVFSALKRRIYRLNRDGRLQDSLLPDLSPPFSANVKLKNAPLASLICVDADNDRVALVSTSGRVMEQYQKGLGCFLRRPVDAAPVADGMAVLDPGNSRLIVLSRNGAGIREYRDGALGKARFFLVTGFGYLVFGEKGEALALSGELLPFARFSLNESFDAGVCLSGNRIFLVSGRKKTVREYKIGVRRTGEVRGMAMALSGGPRK